jgi:AraC-like DNA-binding protein
MADDPATVAAAIAEVIAGLPAFRPRWVRPLPGGARPPRASATGRPRLTIVASGERRVLAPVDGRVLEHKLFPGDVLIVAADGWTVPQPGWQAPIVALNCFDDATRFEAPGVTFDSGGPLNPAAWALLTALVQLGEEPGLRRLAPDLLRTCVTAALADCRPWPDCARARRDWVAARACAHEQPAAGRDRFAAAAGVHPNHLSRLCRRFEGMSLVAWLTRLRMQRARDMLLAGLPVEQVARACGYAEQSHFRRIFRRQHGTSPAAWAAARASDGPITPKCSGARPPQPSTDCRDQNPSRP